MLWNLVRLVFRAASEKEKEKKREKKREKKKKGEERKVYIYLTEEERCKPLGKRFDLVGVCVWSETVCMYTVHRSNPVSPRR